MVSAVTPCDVAPPLLPVNAAVQAGAYFDHGTWRTPGPQVTPLRATPEAAAAGAAPAPAVGFAPGAAGADFAPVVPAAAVTVGPAGAPVGAPAALWSAGA